MMGLFDFLALRADRQIRGLQVFMGASLVSPGLGMSVFLVCHVLENSFNCFCSKTLRFAQGDVSHLGAKRHFFRRFFNAENAPKSPGAFR
jgi:hypothetical protein